MKLDICLHVSGSCFSLHQRVITRHANVVRILFDEGEEQIKTSDFGPHRSGSSVVLLAGIELTFESMQDFSWIKG